MFFADLHLECIISLEKKNSQFPRLRESLYLSVAYVLYIEWGIHVVIYSSQAISHRVWTNTWLLVPITSTLKHFLTIGCELILISLSGLSLVIGVCTHLPGINLQWSLVNTYTNTTCLLWTTLNPPPDNIIICINTTTKLLLMWTQKIFYGPHEFI